MAKKKVKIPKKTDGWMTTYSDLVTLLFCFFVLLYAQSSPDKTKIQYIFQAFQSGGDYLNTVIRDQDPTVRTLGEASPNPSAEVGDDVQEGYSPGEEVNEQSADFSDLFDVLTQAIDSSEISEAIEISGTPTQIRIKFDNDVLFAPDSYSLSATGREALNIVIPGVRALQVCVASIQVQGHTADIQGALSPVNDWDLSSLRAAAVIKYMDTQRTVAGEKFISEGYAQFRPLMANDTTSGRAENRRVELLINKDTTVQGSELFDDIMTFDYNQRLFVTDADGNRIRLDQITHDDLISQIVSTIRENHRGGIEADDIPPEQTGPIPGADSMIHIFDFELVPVEETENGEGSENPEGSENHEGSENPESPEQNENSE